MAWDYFASTPVVVVGNSISAGQAGLNHGPWMDLPGGFRDQYNNGAINYPAFQVPNYIVSTLATPRTAYPVIVQHGHRDMVFGGGIGGQAIAGLSGTPPGTGDTMEAQIFSYAKAWPYGICIFEIATNDFGFGTPQANFDASWTWVLNAFITRLPGWKAIIMGPSIRSETIIGGHPLDNLDTWFGISHLQNFAATNSAWCLYADVLTPMIQHEITFNTLNVSPFDLTYDQLHPLDPAKLIMAAVVMGLLRPR